MVLSFFGLHLVKGAKIIAAVEILVSIFVITGCLIALICPTIFDPVIERETFGEVEDVTPQPHETLRFYFVLALTHFPKTFSGVLMAIIVFKIVQITSAVYLYHGAINRCLVYIRPWLWSNCIAKLLLIIIVFTGVRISVAFCLLLIPLPWRIYSGMAVGTLFDILEDNEFVERADSGLLTYPLE